MSLTASAAGSIADIQAATLKQPSVGAFAGNHQVTLFNI
jgi:hypothetical protein